jgi:hypothetical protein
LLSTLALGLVACSDERLRELGNTASQPLEGSSWEEEEDPRCEPIDFISADAIQREVAADLASLPNDGRPFTRYLSLANRLNEGACPIDLGTDRQAASKLLNSLSREPDVVVPAAFGTGESLLRVDLRAYGFHLAVEANGQTHADHWEAVIAQTPRAIELGGEDGGFIVEQTSTRAPILSVDAFVEAASRAPLYYALLGVPGTLAEVRQSVGLPSELDPRSAGGSRLATDVSRVLGEEGELVAIDRYAIDAGSAGSYFEVFLVDTVALLADPLRLQPAVERQIMFSLPNDLHGFAVTDAAGSLANDAIVLDTNLDFARARVFDSCANCHSQGLIPAEDVVGPAILSRPDLFSEELVAAYRAAPSNEETAAQFAADSQVFQQAVERATGAIFGGDPIATRRFALGINVGLDRVAAELLVTPEQLEANIGELAPELLPLVLGLNLSFEQVSAVYAEAFCDLHAGDENPPDAAFCARVP